MNVFAPPVARVAGVRAVITSQRGRRDLTGSRMRQLLHFSDFIADSIVVNSEAMQRSLVDDDRVPQSKFRFATTPLILPDSRDE